jgi:Tfp pilus assembly protein PilV
MNSFVKTQRQRGLGLIEIAIAVFVLMIAAFSLGKLLIQSSITAANAEARSEALALAQGKLESLRTFSTVADYDAIADPNSPDIVTGTNAVFTVDWSITTNTYPLPSYKTATVSVSWEAPEGNHDLTLISNITREIPVEAGKRLGVLAEWEAAAAP